MIITNDEKNLQSKHDLICHVAKLKLQREPIPWLTLQ